MSHCSVINKSPNDNKMRITRVSAPAESGDELTKDLRGICPFFSEEVALSLSSRPGLKGKQKSLVFIIQNITTGSLRRESTLHFTGATSVILSLQGTFKDSSREVSSALSRFWHFTDVTFLRKLLQYCTHNVNPGLTGNIIYKMNANEPKLGLHIKIIKP